MAPPPPPHPARAWWPSPAAITVRRQRPASTASRSPHLVPTTPPPSTATTAKPMREANGSKPSSHRRRLPLRLARPVHLLHCHLILSPCGSSSSAPTTP